MKSENQSSKLLKSYVKEGSPSPLKKGESDRPSVCTCSGCQCTSAPWNLRAMVQKEATVLVLRAKQAAAKIFIAYTFCDRHSRLQCVYRKERPCLCIKAKKIAAACLALRTGTVASFWTVARKFQGADVH